MAKSSPEPLTVALTAPEAAQALTLLSEAKGLTITDKPSHELTRTFLKGAKALKRTIIEHYEKIKKPLNAARSTVLDMERQHLAPVEEAITIAEKLDTAYVREQARREQEEADRRRLAAEAEELARRESERAEAELIALKLEASSSVLSEREQLFVSVVLASDRTPSALVKAAKLAGYKDPQGQAERLFKSEKIQTAIANTEKAQAIRREAEAKHAQPIIVETEAVESQVAHVAGTSVRAYYSAQVTDLRALLRAVVAGNVPIEAIEPNMVFLNAQARSLKETFPSVYPGCTIGKRDGVTA